MKAIPVTEVEHFGPELFQFGYDSLSEHFWPELFQVGYDSLSAFLNTTFLLWV